jgi:hypothetical protein
VLSLSSNLQRCLARGLRRSAWHFACGPAISQGVQKPADFGWRQRRARDALGAFVMLGNTAPTLTLRSYLVKLRRQSIKRVVVYVDVRDQGRRRHLEESAFHMLLMPTINIACGRKYRTWVSTDLIDFLGPGHPGLFLGLSQRCGNLFPSMDDRGPA